MQGPGDVHLTELDPGGVLVSPALDLDAGDEPDHDLVDLGVEVAAGEIDLSGQRQPGSGVGVGQYGVDARPADPEGTEHPFEDHLASPLRSQLRVLQNDPTVTWDNTITDRLYRNSDARHAGDAFWENPEHQIPTTQSYVMSTLRHLSRSTRRLPALRLVYADGMSTDSDPHSPSRPVAREGVTRR